MSLRLDYVGLYLNRISDMHKLFIQRFDRHLMPLLASEYVIFAFTA